MYIRDTIAAIATPAGVGGIGMVRISGDGAIAVADGIFRAASGRKLAELSGYHAAFGEAAQMDEAVALVYRAPKSYTREDTVEIMCHGGEAAVSAVLTAALTAGARCAEPGEFTKRAFLNGRISLTQAEAAAEAIAAKSDQALRIAKTGLSGALDKKISAMRARLTALSAHLAAYIDFPEEDVPELSGAAVNDTLEGCICEITKLIDGYSGGLAARRGIDAVIAGSPNVGKSTLLNLLSGEERAIVTPIAGTTRDEIENETELGGVRVRLIDTAGLRETADEIERIGVERARKRIESAALIIAVFDGSRELTQSDRELMKKRTAPALAVINKNDLESRIDTAEIEKSFDKTVFISALSGEGAEEVGAAVRQLTGADRIDVNAPLIAGVRQLDAARCALDALCEARRAYEEGITLDAVSALIDEALGALYELTGENASESVIEELFNTFCVGK